MRKLASVRKIDNIRPIPGADRIVVVDVEGWEVVAGKDQFNIGDLAIYFEIDSWIDSSIPAFNTPVFEPRFRNWEGKRGMKLKTIKLRGQISQGLLMPISSFPELDNKRLKEGDDVTDILGIVKWEEPEFVWTPKGRRYKAKGAKTFPSFIPKTDEDRVQNCLNQLEFHRDDTYEVTMKLDGSSMTVFNVNNKSKYWERAQESYHAGKYKGFVGKIKKWWKTNTWFGTPETSITGVCSRNLWVSDDSHFYEGALKTKTLEKVEKYNKIHGTNLAFQGELLAPGIQKNFEGVEDFEFHVFYVWDIDAQKYLSPTEARAAVIDFGLNYVPIEEYGFRMNKFKDLSTKELCQELLNMADGRPMNPPKNKIGREGLVFKSNESNFSFKVISNAYLLYKDGKEE